MTHSTIYLDNHATTQMAPEVFSAMHPFFTDEFGNPASQSHPYGWMAQEAVEKARRQIADGIGAQPKEIYFTSGATESNNQVIFGLLGENFEKIHIVTSSIEHKSVLHPCQEAQRRGAKVSFVAPRLDGRVSVEDVVEALQPETRLVSIMAANNEIGTLNPIKEIGELCKKRGILFHCDAAQAIGKENIDVQDSSIDLLSLSGHKFHGPKGVGALYIRSRQPRIKLQPLLYGGGQERGVRPGTLNVPAIVGLGSAMAWARDNQTQHCQKMRQLQEKFFDFIDCSEGRVQLNGSREHRLPNNINLSLHGIRPEKLFIALSGIAYSSGSACASGSGEASHVLKAIGVSDEAARSTIRFGLSAWTKSEEIDHVLGRIQGLLESRAASPGVPLS